MAHERSARTLNPQQIVPAKYSRQQLLDAEGTELEVVYTKILVGLAQQPGTLGTIFREAQNRIQDPARLKRIIVDLIDRRTGRRRAPADSCSSPTSTQRRAPDR